MKLFDVIWCLGLLLMFGGARFWGTTNDLVFWGVLLLAQTIRIYKPKEPS